VIKNANHDFDKNNRATNYKSITQTLSVGAICAERIWRRRSDLFRHISVYTDDNQTERRRRMRSAQTASTFKCLHSQKKTLKTSPRRRVRAKRKRSA
jgi:hypothetical protein